MKAFTRSAEIPEKTSTAQRSNRHVLTVHVQPQSLACIGPSRPNTIQPYVAPKHASMTSLPFSPDPV
ncbi:hypothetical protein BaRGS_00018327 [Batillaria attramentaria]|uniref:Uncharacterized protein n=1 Tax=Batillaria attramentaria TaxID=370345 RepID=A0ABD0KTN3_9CAEN